MHFLKWISAFSKFANTNLEEEKLSSAIKVMLFR